MTDLLLYVADADAEAFMRAILNKPQALAIRKISFDIERHHERDAGMVQSGSELVRNYKGKYQRAMLLWDHHGSGREHKSSPQEVCAEIQDKLDRFTWSGNSYVSIFVPELEQFLWYCESALCKHCDISPSQLDVWLKERARRLKKTVEQLKTEQPKELFEHIMLGCLRKTISPRDFEKIGSLASVNALMECDGFRSIVGVLRKWFPQ